MQHQRTNRISPLWVALLLVVPALSACSDSKATKIKKEILTGCRSSGGSKQICNCAYDKLTEKYSTEQLTAIASGRSISPDKLMRDFVAGTAACVEEHGR